MFNHMKFYLTTFFIALCGNVGIYANCHVILNKSILYLQVNDRAENNSEFHKIKKNHVKRIMTLHTFIQDILNALKDVCENRKHVEQTILSHWIYHYDVQGNTLDLFVDWDNFDNFLDANGIRNKEIIAKFHEFQQCIYSIIMVFYIKDRFNSLDPYMVLNANKYTLLNVIDELYDYLNQKLVDANYLPVKLNDDLIQFLRCYNHAYVIEG